MTTDARAQRWLYSPGIDTGIFGGSALLSLGLLLLGGRRLAASGDTPTWTWVTAVLMVDVAHVWATAFRVYFDPRELARRPTLYLGVPAAAYVGLVGLYGVGAAIFWRALAYVAIFHFVRQQAGWMALYRARAGERDRTTRLVDGAAIYAATLYPLVYWHTHERHFDWFTPGDVVRLPPVVDAMAFPLYLLALATYAARSVANAARGRPGSPGKDLVVVTTALCWYLGIVTFDSDYAFTVTNVFIHGVPYVALIYSYGRVQAAPAPRPRLAVVLATVWALAYLEELVWDRAVWHERPSLFGGGSGAGDAAAWERYLVPLLALPQVTHYVLDGCLWRRPSNPGLARLFPPRPGPATMPRAGGPLLG